MQAVFAGVAAPILDGGRMFPHGRDPIMKQVPWTLIAAVAALAWLADAAHTEKRLVESIAPPAGERAIQEAIDRLARSGGGRIELAPGEYELRSGLLFDGVRNVELIGRPGVRLVMAAEIVVETAQDAAQGASLIEVVSNAGIAPGMHCEVQAAGRSYASPDGRKHVCPHFAVAVAAVDGRRITIKSPLPYATPKGTKVLHSYNAIAIRGRSANLLFQGLEIDMARGRWPTPPLNHTEHCAVFAATRYDYAKGLLASPVERITVRGCTLRAAHHRGVAWYGVAKSVVDSCRFEELGAEAIDFDHFTVHCRAIENQIRGVPVGVELNDAADCLVQNNRIQDCGRGVNLWRWCAGEQLNVRNVICGNQISGAKAAAIYCGPQTSLTTVRDNRIDGAGKGIQLAGDESLVERNSVRKCAQEGVLASGSRNKIQGNHCERCGEAVKAVGAQNTVAP